MPTSTSETFQIGQTIFACSSKTGTVMPGIVSEEILHKTREGSFVSYKVLIGPPSKQKLIDLTKIDADVFGSVEEMREALIQKLNDYVHNTCEQALETAVAWYGDPNQPSSPTSSGDKIDPQSLMNELGSNNHRTQHNNFVQRQITNNPIQAMRNRAVDDTSLFDRDIHVIAEDGSSKKVTMSHNPKE